MNALDPIARRRQRIHALEQLAARVSTELATERAALRRTLGQRPETSPSAAVAGVKHARVRAWAVANGWPELAGRTSRVPAPVLAAFTAAHDGNDTSEIVPLSRIREWAAGNGWPELVGRPGRVPAAVVEAFAATHPNEGVR